MYDSSVNLGEVARLTKFLLSSAAVVLGGCQCEAGASPHRPPHSGAEAGAQVCGLSRLPCGQDAP